MPLPIQSANQRRFVSFIFVLSTPAIAECSFPMQKTIKEPPAFTVFIYLLTFYKWPQVVIQAAGYVIS